MTVKQLAYQFGVSTRTVQRDIDAFNKANETNHPNGTNDQVINPDLLEYLKAKRKNDLFAGEAEQEQKPKPRRNKTKSAPDPEQEEPDPLRVSLSRPWLVISVIIVILFADMFAFGYVAFDQWGSAWVAAGFVVLGFATGIGAVVTYNRIEDLKSAERWKYIFGALQFTLFEFAVNDLFTLAKLLIGVMFVASFMGALRSIRK